jgi:hypothetical protein
VGVDESHIMGDSEFIDLIEPDSSPAQRSIEGPGVPGDYALPATHAHAEDVHELGVVTEQ